MRIQFSSGKKATSAQKVKKEVVKKESAACRVTNDLTICSRCMQSIAHAASQAVANRLVKTNTIRCLFMGQPV